MIIVEKERLIPCADDQIIPTNLEIERFIEELKESIWNHLAENEVKESESVVYAAQFVTTGNAF